MSNKEKYDKVFIECFSVDPSALNSEFIYQSIPAWDSVGHMSLISVLEETFNIMLETDDIIEFSSYTNGMEILAKYGVKL